MISNRKYLEGLLLSLCALLLSGPALGLNRDALMSTPAPRWISEFDLFSDIAAQQPNAGLVPYEINTPLFSDYTDKHRFIGIPTGTAATYHPTEVLDFPVGTVLVKTFAYSAKAKKPPLLLETRLLVHREEGWDALTYVWNQEQDDARLKIAGGRIPLTFTDPRGQQHDIQYLVPNKNQCKGCHDFNRQVRPIGPSARQLNRNYIYAGQSRNQLEYLATLGWLKELPDKPEHLPRLARWDDERAPLDARARAYLEINCAHCHRPEGAASQTNLYLTQFIDGLQLGIRKRPVAAGRGSGELLQVISPGKPQESILLFRMDNNSDPDIMMPELGRSVNHVEGIELIREWIKHMPE